LNTVPARDAAPTLTALNGIRFFAVFHIFLHHIWSVRFETPRGEGPFANAYSTLDSFPGWLNNLLAHGYLSTSFFFLLAGFILSYLARTSSRSRWRASCAGDIRRSVNRQQHRRGTVAK
jgi:peptidoglycan/LPS O-acetylase OafA/YrhL